MFKSNFCFWFTKESRRRSFVCVCEHLKAHRMRMSSRRSDTGKGGFLIWFHKANKFISVYYVDAIVHPEIHFTSICRFLFFFDLCGVEMESDSEDDITESTQSMLLLYTFHLLRSAVLLLRLVLILLLRPPGEDSDRHPCSVQLQVKTPVFQVQVQVRSPGSDFQVQVQAEPSKVNVHVKPAVPRPRSQVRPLLFMHLKLVSL